MNVSKKNCSAWAHVLREGFRLGVRCARYQVPCARSGTACCQSWRGCLDRRASHRKTGRRAGRPAVVLNSASGRIRVCPTWQMPSVLPALTAPCSMLERYIKDDAMSENKAQVGDDGSLVNIYESYTARNWARSLGCTLEVLKEAVNAVGPSADSVRRYLAQR